MRLARGRENSVGAVSLPLDVIIVNYHHTLPVLLDDDEHNKSGEKIKRQKNLARDTKKWRKTQTTKSCCSFELATISHDHRGLTTTMMMLR